MSCRYWQVLKSCPGRVQFETPQRFATYRLRRRPKPTPITDIGIVVTNLDTQAGISTYNVWLADLELTLIVCHFLQKGPQKKCNLGRGSQGIVRLERSSKRCFAVKRLYKYKNRGDKRPSHDDTVSMQSIQDVLREYAITKACAFYQIGPDVDVSIGFDLLCYADCLEFHLQLCKPASYHDIINSESTLKENLRLMHSLHIIHRDIKPSNILYSDQQKRCVFSDFGISHVSMEVPGQQSEVCYEGTQRFMSPEMQKLRAAKGQCGRVDLYSNDLYSLLETLSYCREKLLDHRGDCRMPFNRNLKKDEDPHEMYLKDRKFLQEAFSVDFSKSSLPTDASINEYSLGLKRQDQSHLIHESQLCTHTSEQLLSEHNYEFLKFKFCFITDQIGMIMHDEESFLNESQLIEVLGSVIRSASGAHIERIFQQTRLSDIIDSSLPVRKKFEELKQIRMWEEYRSQEAYFPRENDNTIRLLIRAYGYSEEVLYACSTAKTSSFVQQVRDYIKYQPPVSNNKRRLRQKVKVLRGDARLKAYKQWDHLYETETSKDLLELLDIELFLYRASRTPSELTRIVSTLERLQGAFPTKAQNDALELVLTNLKKLTSLFRVDFLDSKVAGILTATFNQVFAISKRDAWHENVNRLSYEVAFDTKKWLLVLEKEHLTSITAEQHILLFEAIPLQTWNITQLINHSYFSEREITSFINSLNTFDFTNDELISDEALQILKATTYYNLFQAFSDPASVYRQELRRFGMLKRVCGRYDFAIAQSYGLLAWAQHLLKNDDRAAQLRKQGEYVFSRRSRTIMQQLTFSELQVMITFHERQSAVKLNRLRALYESHSQLKQHSIFATVIEELVGVRQLTIAQNLRDQMKLASLYLPKHGYRSQMVQLTLILNGLTFGSNQQLKQQFTSTQWIETDSAIRMYCLLIRCTIDVWEGRSNSVIPLINQYEAILRTSSSDQLEKHLVSVWAHLYRLYNLGIFEWLLAPILIFLLEEHCPDALLKSGSLEPFILRKTIMLHLFPLLERLIEYHSYKPDGYSSQQVLQSIYDALTLSPQQEAKAYLHKYRDVFVSSQSVLKTKTVERLKMKLMKAWHSNSKPSWKSFWRRFLAAPRASSSEEKEFIKRYIRTTFLNTRTNHLYSCLISYFPLFYHQLEPTDAAKLISKDFVFFESCCKATRSSAIQNHANFFLNALTAGGKQKQSSFSLTPSKQRAFFLAKSEDEFVEDSHRILQNQEKRTHKAQFRTKHLFYQTFTVMRSPMQDEKRRDLIQLAAHLKAMRQHETALEYLRDAAEMLDCNDSELMRTLTSRISSNQSY